MTRIGVTGSTRPNRNGERPARWVHDIAARRDDAGFELVGLRDYPVPHLDEPLPPSLGQYHNSHTRERAAIMCQHQPPCPPAGAVDREAARVLISHPEQGWSLLCNGTVLFEDTGALLPGGQSIPPHRPAVPKLNAAPPAASAAASDGTPARTAADVRRGYRSPAR